MAGAEGPSRASFLDPVGTLRWTFRRRRRIAEWDWDSFRASAGALERRAGRPLEGARVLDLGCGPRFPAALLFHSFGARVTGIDVDYPGPRSWRTLLRRCLFDPGYYRALRLRAGRPLRFQGLDLRRMDARALDFLDGEFDLVHSTAVFEHLEDVPAVAHEMARVLKPSGAASVVIHLFPSLSGGHRPEWAFPNEEASRRVPPWDHLRENLFPSGVYLNRRRERDFREAIENYFEIVEEERFTEGEGFLTPEIEREIPAYGRAELTTRAVRWVLRRPADRAAGDPLSCGGRPVPPL
jgi:SAM-dependent methyltransferase